MENYSQILASQKQFFLSQKTKDIAFRKSQLRQFKKGLDDFESKMTDAIFKDFGKTAFSTLLTELLILRDDVDYYLKNIDRLSQSDRVPTNLVNQLGNSRIYKHPLGNTLVIGAWNYPFLLTLSPVVAAMAAGNTCIIKPSELPANTMKVIKEMIHQYFDPNYLYVVEGGVPEATALLKLKFDKIFFTGSTKVGQIVYEAAAKHLTPVTLELGGKSPVIVTSSAKISLAVQRIVWAKFVNAGQTCVAPDYILVQENIKSQFLDALIKEIKKQSFQLNEGLYNQIINHRNFDRLMALIDQDKVIHGGGHDRDQRWIEPTIMDEVTWEDTVMQEEIFGPILPILTYNDLRQTLLDLNDKPTPLSAYLFSTQKSEKKLFTDVLAFGGGCINDALMHLSNHHLPFGGLGSSGMGNYHGPHGFDTFSHQKSVLERSNVYEAPLKYPPHTDQKLNIIKKIF